MEIILSILFVAIFVLLIMTIAIVAGSLLYHFTVERRMFPEFQAPAKFREDVFRKYLQEIERGDFEHDRNAEAIAFFSLKKRKLLKDATRKGEEKKFDSEIEQLKESEYKSFLSPSVLKLARKNPEKMYRLKLALYERRKEKNFCWDSAWDAFIWDFDSD